MDKAGIGPFCSTCGEKQKPQMIRSFKPDFIEVAKKKFGNQTPEELFEAWNNRDWSTKNLQFHIVDPISRGEDWGSASTYVLGYHLLSYECSDYRGRDLFSIDLNRINEIHKSLFEVICDLGYTTREIKLYLCTDVSC
jgi:hypothetical protein